MIYVLQDTMETFLLDYVSNAICTVKAVIKITASSAIIFLDSNSTKLLIVAIANLDMLSAMGSAITLQDALFQSS